MRRFDIIALLSLNEPGEAVWCPQNLLLSRSNQLAGLFIQISHTTVRQPVWPTLFISLQEDVNKTNELINTQIMRLGNVNNV